MLAAAELTGVPESGGDFSLKVDWWKQANYKNKKKSQQQQCKVVRWSCFCCVKFHPKTVSNGTMLQAWTKTASWIWCPTKRCSIQRLQGSVCCFFLHARQILIRSLLEFFRRTTMKSEKSRCRSWSVHLVPKSAHFHHGLQWSSLVHL